MKMSSTTMELVGPSKLKQKQDKNRNLLLGFSLGILTFLGAAGVLYFINLFAPTDPVSAQTMLSRPTVPDAGFTTAVQAERADLNDSGGGIEFTRESDNRRAEEFRQLTAREQQIKSLLAQALKFEQAGRYYGDGENNALAAYQRILSLDNGNRRAKRAMQEISTQLLAETESMIEASNHDAAQQRLLQLWSTGYAGQQAAALQSRLVAARIDAALQSIAQVNTKNTSETVDKSSEGSGKADTSLLPIEKSTTAVSGNEGTNDTATAEETKTLELDKRLLVAELVSKAEMAFARERITRPVGDNALGYYKQLQLKVGPVSESILGIQRVSNYYVEKANEAFSADRLDTARTQLEVARAIEPDNLAVRLLQEQIERRDQELQQTAVNRKERAALNQALDDAGQKLAQAEKTAERAKKQQQEIVALRQALDKSRDGLQRAEEQQVLLTKQRQELMSLRQALDEHRTRLKEKETELVQQKAAVDRNRRQDRVAILEAGMKAYYDADYVTAMKHLAPLAEQGNARAQFRVGIMYLAGRGVSTDRDTSTYWLQKALPDVRKSAAEGVAWAQSDLATLYEEGLLLPENHSEAVTWYQRAVAQNYIGALTNLGVMYANGVGVVRNRETAIRLLKQAASKGDRVARQNLKVLGVPIAE